MSINANRLASKIVRLSDLDSSPVASGLLAGVGGGRRRLIKLQEDSEQALARHMAGVLGKVSRASAKYAQHELTEPQRKIIVRRRAEMLKAHTLAVERLQRANLRLEQTLKASKLHGKQAPAGPELPSTHVIRRDTKGLSYAR